MADENHDDILSLEDLVEEVQGGAEDIPRNSSSEKETANAGEPSPADDPTDVNPSLSGATPGGVADDSTEGSKSMWGGVMKRLHPAFEHPTLQRARSAVSRLAAVSGRLSRVIPLPRFSKLLLVEKALRRFLKRGVEKAIVRLIWIIRAPWAIRLQVLLLLVLVGALVVVTRFVLLGDFLQKPEPFAISSLESQADAVFRISPDEYYESFASSLRQPEHYILFNKIIVQLKPYPNQRHPMATMQLYAEASSQDAAIELQNREGEFLDLIQRTLEQYPVDELATRKGKADLKDHLRVKLNQKMSRGRVHALYFHEFLLKR